MDIRVLFAPQNSCIDVDFGFLRRIEDTEDDCDFIETLFMEKDVRFYLVLQDDHYRDIRLFHKYLVKNKLSYIYENKQRIPMGLFSCEIRQADDGALYGFMAYALLPFFRGHGYIESALISFCTICRNSQLSYIVLDICESNTASIRIAKKSGFSNIGPDGQKAVYVDPERLEMGMRYRWYYNLHQAVPERERLCRQAMQAYRMEDYQQSIALFNQALAKECPSTCQFSDAQILANVAMAYSSVENYKLAYQCLIRAYNAGIRNDSVVKEINWIRNNVPWDCI